MLIYNDTYIVSPCKISEYGIVNMLDNLGLTIKSIPSIGDFLDFASKNKVDFPLRILYVQPDSCLNISLISSFFKINCMSKKIEFFILLPKGKFRYKSLQCLAAYGVSGILDLKYSLPTLREELCLLVKGVPITNSLVKLRYGTLTKYEWSVLVWTLMGKTLKEMSFLRKVSIKTLSDQRKRALEKLNYSSTREWLNSFATFTL